MRKKKEVELQYCGMAYKMPVVGVRQLVEATYWSLTKSAARRVPFLVPLLWCEKDLLPATWLGAAACGRLDEQILGRMRAGRKAANALLGDEDRTGTQVASRLKKCYKTLLLHDPIFACEKNWWGSAVGAPGGELMAGKIRDIMSTAGGTKILTLHETAQLAWNLMKSSLFQFVLPQYQAEVTGLAGWLKALKAGELQVAAEFPRDDLFLSFYL